jgi:hypothetical protein
LNYAHLLELTKTDRKEAFKQIGLLLNQHPEDYKLVALFAQAFQRDDQYGLAYNLWKRVLQLDKKPECAIFNNLGLTAACIGGEVYHEEANRHWKRALELNPKNTPSLNNLALYALHSGDYERCLSLCQKSLAVEDGQPEVFETRAYANLMLGKWKEGWEDWEWSVGGKCRPHYDIEPYWKGEKGVDLLLRGEQGLGDEISFASVLPDAIKDNRITLECDYRLEGLFKRSFTGLEIHGTRRAESRGKFQGHTHRALIGSLPKYYRNSADEFPGTAYLVADPVRRQQWRAVFDSMPGKKIGIAWTGGRQNTFAERRSFDLEALLPILKTDNTFISLQYRDPQDEIDALKEKHGIDVKHYRFATAHADYDSTAALVAECDLVISATTAIAHLCGALGKECLVLVPRKPRWFYGKEGRRIPWYKSVELFRQTKEGWPIAEVAERIRG